MVTGEMVRRIADTGNIKYEPFTSAAGIEGNVKIHFIEALDADSELKKEVVSTMAGLLSQATILIGVPSGGHKLAQEISTELDVPCIHIEKAERNGRKVYKIPYDQWSLLGRNSVLGYVEDITSTLSSLARLERHPCLRDRPAIGAGGMRRGVTMPEGMTQAEMEDYNMRFAFRPPLEYALPFEMQYAAETPLPLWVPLKKQLANWLPGLDLEKV